MKRSANFVMSGGGTGGHVIPALAVAAELRARGHSAPDVGLMTAMSTPPTGLPNACLGVPGTALSVAPPSLWP